MECMGHLFCSFFGKISVYPHTILHKSRSHRGNLRAIVTPLPSFIQYCKHNELWGCAEISPDLTSSKLRFDGDVSFFGKISAQPHTSLYIYIWGFIIQCITSKMYMHN